MDDCHFFKPKQLNGLGRKCIKMRVKNITGVTPSLRMLAGKLRTLFVLEEHNVELERIRQSTIIFIKYQT